jgi:hypothetical protein
MAVDVDGKRVLTSFVSATTYKDHVATVALAAGAHTVKVAFLNDLMSTCDRNLIVDNVTLAPALLPIVTPTPTPTPTPPLSHLDAHADHGLGVVEWRYLHGQFQPVRGGADLHTGSSEGRRGSAWCRSQGDQDDSARLRCGPVHATDNPRGQVLSPSILREGGEYWVGWSVLVPQSFPTTTTSGDNWISLGSIYGPPFAGKQLERNEDGHDCRRDKFYYRRGSDYGYDEPWSMPLIRGRWVDFVYHLKMSRDGTVGFREQWGEHRGRLRPAAAQGPEAAVHEDHDGGKRRRPQLLQGERLLQARNHELGDDVLR